MALILSVERGHSILVGQQNPVKVVVDEIMSSQNYKLRVELPSHDTVYTITNRTSTEVVPKVRIAAGRGTNQVAKLVIEAPRNIAIMREDLMQE